MHINRKVSNIYEKKTFEYVRLLKRLTQRQIALQKRNDIYKQY